MKINKWFLLSLCILAFITLFGGLFDSKTVHASTSLGTCGSNNQYTCSTTATGGTVISSAAVPSGECGINATKQGLSSSTQVFCCKVGTKGTLGTCGSSGADACITTSCSSANTVYSNFPSSDQCVINYLKSTSSPTKGLTLYCLCTGTNCSNSASPTPTLTPTPTGNPAATATPTTQPNGTITPSPTFPPGSTLLAVDLSLPGIGTDSAKGDNTNPLHPQRDVKIELSSIEDVFVGSFSGTVIFDNQLGNFDGHFVGAVDLGTNFPTGQYLVRVQTPQFLRKLIPRVETITQGTSTALPYLTLISGDIVSDNVIDIEDYSALVSCFGSKATTSSCLDKNAADLNDDGVIDGIDYNLILRSFAIRTGD